MNSIPFVLPENTRLSRSYVNRTFVNVEWVSAWLTIIKVNMRMKSRMLRLKVSLSSSL